MPSKTKAAQVQTASIKPWRAKRFVCRHPATPQTRPSPVLIEPQAAKFRQRVRNQNYVVAGRGQQAGKPMPSRRFRSSAKPNCLPCSSWTATVEPRFERHCPLSNRTMHHFLSNRGRLALPYSFTSHPWCIKPVLRLRIPHSLKRIAQKPPISTADLQLEL